MKHLRFSLPYLPAILFFVTVHPSGAQQLPVAEPSTLMATAEPTAADTAILKPKGLGLAPEDDLLQARQRAISLAGAFANDGYRMRDGSWALYLSENQPAMLALWLFARNGVWLSAATAEKGATPHLEVFDPQGNPVATLLHAAAGATAAGFVVPVTGKYTIRASLNAPSTPFCLVYSYK